MVSGGTYGSRQPTAQGPGAAGQQGAARFGPHLAAVVQRGTPGAADRRLECWFDTVPAAAAARHAAADNQLVRLRAVPGSGDVVVPVKLSAGRLHCQQCCLLDCAGCPRNTYTDRGEFFGDLAGELAAGSYLVSNGSAYLAYIHTPDDDRHLGRFPKHFSSMEIEDQHYAPWADASAMPANQPPGRAVSFAAGSTT
ncbi:g7993 [Coccomyxa elongata]